MTRIWWILTWATEILKIFTLIGSFLTQYIKFDLKKSTEELSFTTLKSDEKLTGGFENDMRNMANFHQSTWKSQNWDFDGIILSEVENVWA